MSLVLAIESDHRQATILKRIVREYVQADLVLVDSRDAAVAAIAARIPDVILVTALLSPRDEEELVGYLRGLDGADHLQTYTIPQLAFTAADSDQKNGGGLFGKFRKKKDADATVGGCDPEHFAEEIRTFLERATERKNERAASAQQRKAHEEFRSRTEATNPSRTAAAPKPAAEEAQPPSDSAWSDPFAWRPASERAATPQPPRPQAAPPSLVTNVPLAVVAEDQEEQAARAREFALEEIAAEAEEKARQEIEARARQEDEERRREQQKRERADAEAGARRKREDEERRKREEEERKRLEAESAAHRKREEEERKRREEEERKKREAEVVARKKREEEERKRLEAEAAARRKREEEERKRLEAEAAARRKREEEERKRREEEERRRREEEERQRLEAEAAARRKREEEERKRHEEEERKRREEEERKREEVRARRRAEEEEARQREEEQARRREEEEARRRERQREIAAASADPFKEFRADHDEPSGVLRLIPVSSWARVERRKSDDEEPAARDEFLQVLSGLRIPQQVAAISYPRGCRIRRVRVRALEQPEPPTDSKSTLIVSRKALQESRTKPRGAGR